MDLVRKKTEKSDVESTRGEFYRSPACDITENENEYVIKFDIPGVEKNDLSLNVEKNVLSLTAECRKQAGPETVCLREEIDYSGYKRSFDLGDSVDTDAIKADYKNGTLKLVLPKREERKTRQIKIDIA
jgi:HSP20 family protein